MSAAALFPATQIATQTAPQEPLSAVGMGQMSLILDVQAPESDARRLKAMGLCAGRTVRVVSTGNPMIVQVLGSRVGLSASLAACVSVKAR